MKELEIVTPVGRPLRADQIKREVARALRLSRNAAIRVMDPTQPERPFEGQASATCVIVHRSIDARGRAVMRHKVEVYGPDEHYEPYRLPDYQDVHDAPAVLVIGAGPAGMFAALKLLTLGFKPVVLERGRDVHSRKVDMARLSREGVLDPDSNYCFGEGGAGAFSDGKLYTRSSKRGDNREVLHQLVLHGASPDILIDAHPHIGTDRLPRIVENIRHTVEEYGGEYHFGARVVSIDAGDRVSVTTADGVEFVGESVILATGHSARDVYEMLDGRGWALEAKGFALGVRVEHPQSLINDARYHGHFEPGMPAAEYSFVEQVDGRGVFSFCMCPGGVLVPSSTEPETVVLNGMSNSARNSRWADAGVVVSIEPGDEPEKYGADGAFALLNFQRDVEREMYSSLRSNGSSLGHPFAAPAQRMVDFCKGRASRDLPETSYHPGAVSAPLHKILPEVVSSRLSKAFPLIDRKIPGYYTNDALLLGVESRTSSPVRIPRNPQTLEYVSVARIFPCGEGAGYSGGIVSSAIDGIRCALAAAAIIG